MRALGIGIIALATIASLAAAEDTKLGAGVTLTDATPIEALIERPRDFAGKTIRIDGVATAVCQHMGCWMAVASEKDPGGATVRLKVDDGVIVFPMSAKGKKVSAEGIFRSVGNDGEAKEAAAEHAKHDAKASGEFQLAATGAIVR